MQHQSLQPTPGARHTETCRIFCYPLFTNPNITAAASLLPPVLLMMALCSMIHDGNVDDDPDDRDFPYQHAKRDSPPGLMTSRPSLLLDSEDDSGTSGFIGGLPLQPSKRCSSNISRLPSVGLRGATYWLDACTIACVYGCKRDRWVSV